MSCNNNLIFKMCSPQIGIVVKDYHDEAYYKDVYTLINLRIDLNSDHYDYIESIEFIEVMYSII